MERISKLQSVWSHFNIANLARYAAYPDDYLIVHLFLVKMVTSLTFLQVYYIPYVHALILCTHHVLGASCVPFDSVILSRGKVTEELLLCLYILFLLSDHE